MQQIICINNIAFNDQYPNGTKIGGLTLQKTYTIENSEKIDGDTVVWITNDDNQYFAYFLRDFMYIEEWRELQINKIIE